MSLSATIRNGIYIQACLLTPGQASLLYLPLFIRTSSVRALTRCSTGIPHLKNNLVLALSYYTKVGYCKNTHMNALLPAGLTIPKFSQISPRLMPAEVEG